MNIIKRIELIDDPLTLIRIFIFDHLLLENRLVNEKH